MHQTSQLSISFTYGDGMAGLLVTTEISAGEVCRSPSIFLSCRFLSADKTCALHHTCVFQQCLSAQIYLFLKYFQQNIRLKHDMIFSSERTLILSVFSSIDSTSSYGARTTNSSPPILPTQSFS